MRGATIVLPFCDRLEVIDHRTKIGVHGDGEAVVDEEGRAALQPVGQGRDEGAGLRVDLGDGAGHERGVEGRPQGGRPVAPREAVALSITNSLVAELIDRSGTAAQKTRWLRALTSGAAIGAFALSEPEAGSDPGGMITRAERADGGWVINGTKNWITNGPVADVCVLFTMNDKAAGHRGITAFILPMKTKGVRVGTPDDKLGIRGSKSSQIFLDDAR